MVRSNSEGNAPIQELVVLGGGSAGFIAAITLKLRLAAVRVTVIRSKEIGVIGVGEGTTPVILDHLHGYLGLNPTNFYKRANPTWKLGVRFEWGPHEYFNYTFSSQFDFKQEGFEKRNGFYCLEDPLYADASSALMSENRVFLRGPDGMPKIWKNLAYHLENETFVNYLEEVAEEIGVDIQEGKVAEVSQNDQGIESLVLEDGRSVAGDFFVDSSGFASVLLGGALGERFVSFADSLFCDSAVTGGWERGPEEPIKPYTTSSTMDSGWCWQVELERRINRGYVYSSSFISDEEAEAEFRRVNPSVENTRVVRFVTGRRERTWVKNVVGIGNAAGFVEPLESTSLGVICDDAQAIAEALADCDLRPNETLMAEYCDRSRRMWEPIRNFLAVHYRFNTRRETPFWKECNEKVELHGAQRVVDYYRQNGPSALWRNFSVDHIDQFRLEGYLAQLVGQQAPTERHFSATADELKKWQAHRAKMKKEAQNGFTVEEGLAMVRRPEWQWQPGFYSS